jgi:hypothetical protein
VVFGSGNRLLDKQLAEKGQVRGGTLVVNVLGSHGVGLFSKHDVRSRAACSILAHLGWPPGEAWTACVQLQSTCATSNLMHEEQTKLSPSMRHDLAQVGCGWLHAIHASPLMALQDGRA